MAEVLKIGGREVAVSDARQWVKDFLNGKPGQYGYPSYDGYRTNDDPSRLCDGDLLAPVLLNVQMKIKSFADLKDHREALESSLKMVPCGLELADADDAALEKIGGAYAILDQPTRPRNIQGTTLAKILHRKRPALIPLYDKRVKRVYQDSADAPVPPVKRRHWAEFMRLLAISIRQDLNRAPEQWDEFMAFAPPDGPPVSRLRVLDIVAWRLGGNI